MAEVTMWPKKQKKINKKKTKTQTPLTGSGVLGVRCTSPAYNVHQVPLIFDSLENHEQ